MLLPHSKEVEIYRTPSFVKEALVGLIFSVKDTENFKRCNNYIRVYKTNKSDNGLCDAIVEDLYYVIDDATVNKEMENISCKEDEYITIRSFIRMHNNDAELNVNLEVNMVER